MEKKHLVIHRRRNYIVYDPCAKDIVTLQTSNQNRLPDSTSYKVKKTLTAVSVFKVELIYRNCYHIFIRIFQVKEDMSGS